MFNLNNFLVSYNRLQFILYICRISKSVSFVIYDPMILCNLPNKAYTLEQKPLLTKKKFKDASLGRAAFL